MTHYIFIVGPLVLASFIVLFIITAMWERQVLSGDVEPATEPYPYSPSAYWLATRDAATQLGLRHAGDFATKKHTTLVKGLKSLWVTQDNLVIAAAFSGSFAGAPLKKTVLRSRLNNGQVIESSDDPGLDDISKTVARAVLLNASIEELIRFHVQRIVKSGAVPTPFKGSSVLADFEQVDLDKGAQMVVLGMARWVGSSRTSIRLTFRGALAHVTQSLFMQIAKLLPQQDRINLPRAGG
jgi:hypothetical protein